MYPRIKCPATSKLKNNPLSPPLEDSFLPLLLQNYPDMKPLKLTSVIAIIIACTFFESLVQACADGDDPYDYYYSFFRNDMAGSPAYRPFYYTGWIKYYDEYYWEEDEHREKLPDYNIAEWLGYTGKGISESDAAGFIYKFGYNDLKSLYYHIEQAKPLKIPDSVAANSMTKWFLEKKDLEALGYLMYAKQCEPNAVQESSWELPQRDAAHMDKMIKNGLQLHKAAKQDFFRWRYAYQVIRMAFYKEDYVRTHELYKELVGGNKAGNIMYYRCLGFEAGAYYRQGDYNRAAYLYSLVFDGSEELKRSVYISYDWCFASHENERQADKKQVEQYCTDDHQRAVLCIMDALHEYEDALPLIKKAYALDPDVPGLDVVMTREINKLESRYFDPVLRRKSGFNNAPYFYDSKRYDADAYRSEERANELQRQQQLLNNLLAFADKAAAEQKSKYKAFWSLSAAYLCFIKGEWKNCESRLAAAEKSNPTDKEKDMLHIERLLLQVCRDGKINDKTEAAILPSLQWLEQRAATRSYFNRAYRNLLLSVLPNTYILQQDTLKAVLCIARGTIGTNGTKLEPAFFSELDQVSTDNIITLKTFIGKQGSGKPFDKWLTGAGPFRDGALDDYIGARYIRQHDFAKALVVLKTIPDSIANNYALLDPFTDRVKDTQEPKEEDLPVYTRHAFSLEMQRLKDRGEKASAEELYKYATGLYSMTYYGLSWNAGIYYRSGNDQLGYFDSDARQALLPEYRDYYSCEEALRYYQLAFDKSNDQEFKARCLYMMAKCWQKNFRPTEDKYRYDPSQNNDYLANTLSSPYFRQLVASYSGTGTYSQLLTDCTYLSYYLKKMPKNRQ